MGLRSFKFSWWASKDACVLKRSAYDRSGSSKVVDFGTGRKLVYDFLLIIDSSLGSYIAPFQTYCRFSVQNSDPTLFHANFGGVPFRLDGRCCGSEERRPKLIIRVINFELVQPICPWYISVTDGRTERRTDDLR